MTEVERKVLERSTDGDYQFSEYGEFLSYYHTHLQLFNKIITDNSQISEKDKNTVFSKIKSFMKENVKKTDHFFEQSPNFAEFLAISQEELTNYMNQNFLNALTKVQKKLKEQEMEKLAHSNDFSCLMEEILVKANFNFPTDSRYTFKDALLVIENIKTGEIYKPQGMLNTIKEEQDKAQEEKEKRQKTLQRLKEKPADEFIDEISILEELVNKYGELTPIALELKSDIPAIEVQRIVETKKEKKPKGLLDDVEDLDIDLSSTPEIEALDEEPDYEEEEEEEEPQEEEPGLLDDIESMDFSKKKETPPDDDLSDILGAIGGESTGEEEETEPEEELPPPPDIADEFNFKKYSEINKIIQSFKAKNDINGYNNWMKSSGSLEKTFISIKTNLAKEAGGAKFDWNSFYNSVASKTELDANVVEKLKNKISHLNKTKQFLDICIKQLKTQPPEVINILKTGWPHILDAFGDAPDYENVTIKLKNLLSRIKSNSQKAPIEKILFQAISKLKTMI